VQNYAETDNQNKKTVVNNRLFAVNKTPLSATVDGEGEGAVEGHTSLATPNVRPSGESTDPNSVVSQSASHVAKPGSKPQVQPNVLEMS
jgi:hypothetical protein